MLPSKNPHNHEPSLSIAESGSSSDEVNSEELDLEAKIDQLNQEAWSAYDERFSRDPLRIAEPAGLEQSREEESWQRHANAAKAQSVDLTLTAANPTWRQSLKRHAERQSEMLLHRKGHSWKQADRTHFFLTTKRTGGLSLQRLRKPIFQPPREVDGSWLQQFVDFDKHITNMGSHNLTEMTSRVETSPAEKENFDCDRRGEDRATLASSMAPEKYINGPRVFAEYVDQWSAVPSRSALVSDSDAEAALRRDCFAERPRLPRRDLLQALLGFSSEFAEQMQPVPHYGYDLAYSCDPSALIAMSVLCEELLAYLLLGSNFELSGEQIASMDQS
ncbi:hypothetical protein HDU86_001112 [Geranomyces michiganensis]|nr:hypothetical protein HDU86_001112 [Geranomyces michiganensis]